MFCNWTMTTVFKSLELRRQVQRESSFLQAFGRQVVRLAQMDAPQNTRPPTVSNPIGTTTYTVFTMSGKGSLVRLVVESGYGD
jgi:hypothetical protein